MRYLKVLLGITLWTLSHITWAQLNHDEISVQELRFLGEADIPFKKLFQGTVVGGLSGIDYDPKHELYYLISDDRSALNPARFYTAKIRLNNHGIDSVQFLSVHSFLQQDGNVYPSSKSDPAHTPDPEAIRYDALKDELFWTSEGERIVKENNTVIEDPAITVVTTAGRYVSSIKIPANTKMQAVDKGPRQNGGFEGMTFTPDFQTLFFNVELPLYEDGAEPAMNVSNSWIRIYQYDVKTKKNTAQYAYPPEPVAFPAIPATAFKINGIPDMLSLGNQKLLVMERSFSSGRTACTIRVYKTDLRNADNILNVLSLKETPPKHAAEKKLILNMDDLGMYTDNIEGMTFGPNLPNGHNTLIFVSDDNFQPFEKTQFLLFEVIPEHH